MSYTPIILFLLGLLGIIAHNLVELDKLNKSSNCTFSIRQYFKLELFSICISIIVCFVTVLLSQEIRQIKEIGNWMGLAFFAFGYMGQSLLIFGMGKVNKIVNTENIKNTNQNEQKEQPSSPEK